MEFKSLLKEKRKARGVTQQELADAIYVSRSAVAKWESGLGIPGSDSYEALLNYFGLTREELPLNEVKETLAVEKTQRVRLIAWISFWIITVSVISYTLWLMYAIEHGYGFTPDMAAGDIWADDKRITRPEYVFYYNTTEGAITVIMDFAVVEKKAIGYQRLYPTLSADGREVVDESGEKIGDLLSFKGKEKYYHLFRSTLTMYHDKSGVYLNFLPEVIIKEERHEVLHHSFFETSFPVTEFYCEGRRFLVK